MISLRTLFLFYRRHLRVQPVRELMAVAGVAAGVALLFAVQIANSSITGSFEEIVHGVAGKATLEVAARGPEGFNERIEEEVAGIPDVKAAAPILQQQVVVVGPEGSRALTLVGADERLGSLGGKLIAHLERYTEASRRGLLAMAEPTARAIGARPGSVVAIRIGGRTEHLSLAAPVPSGQLGPLAKSPIAVASLPVVQVLAHLPNRITRVLVEPSSGRTVQVRQALRRLGTTLNVRSVNREAALLAGAAKPESQLTALFSAISLLLGIVLAYNALLLASGERRAFIIYLRQLGTPELAIVASLAFDAFILGIAGSALGLLLGDIISLYAYRPVPGYITAAFPIGGQRVVSWSAILLAFSAGMLAAFAAAALPAIGVLRSGPWEAGDAARARSTSGELRRPATAAFAVGVVLAGTSLASSTLAPATSLAASVGLAAGLVLCLPFAARHLLKLSRAASRHLSDPSARLSSAELLSSPTRSVAVLATGAIAVFLMVTIGGSIADVQRAVRLGAAQTGSSADLWIRPGGSENIYATVPFDATDTLRRLKPVSGLGSVLIYRQSFLDLHDRRVWVIGVPPQARAPIAPSQFVDGGLARATRRLREGGWVLISQTNAKERHLRLGDRLILPTPSGPASLRLAGTIANYGWVPGTVLMNADDYAKLWRTTLASQLAVTLKPGVSTEQAKLEVQRAMGGASALGVQTADELRSQVSTVLGASLTRVSVATTLVLVAAIVSLVAMMVAAVWQRRGRLDALMSIGMSLAQLARLVLYESGLVLLAGCVIGLIFGIGGQYVAENYLPQTTGGSTVQFSPAWQLGLLAILIAAGVSVLAATIAVIRTVRFQPRAAFSTE
jgi:putative ABC transport system permease protein